MDKNRMVLWYGIEFRMQEADYKEFERAKDREKYIRKLKKKYGEFSYNSLDSDDISGENILIDTSIDIEEYTIRKIMGEMAMDSLTYLSAEDEKLIRLLVLEGRTVRDVAKLYGVNINAIHKKKQRILNMLRKILKI